MLSGTNLSANYCHDELLCSDSRVYTVIPHLCLYNINRVIFFLNTFLGGGDMI